MAVTSADGNRGGLDGADGIAQLRRLFRKRSASAAVSMRLFQASDVSSSFTFEERCALVSRAVAKRANIVTLS